MTHSRSGLHAASRRFDAALRQTVPAMLLRAGLSSDPEHPPLRVERAPTATAPTQMATLQSRDAATRAQLETLYATCQKTYRESIRPQDTEDDDAGAAVALFISANLHVLHDEQATPDMFEALELQLRGVTRRSAEWDAASQAQRQAFFERIAILAVLMAGSLDRAKSEGPAALADLRRTARQYLQQMLGVNPDLLTIGPTGLVMRGR